MSDALKVLYTTDATAICAQLRSPAGRKHLIGMAYPYYATMKDEDLDAIVTYLRSVPPSPPIEKTSKSER